MEDNTEDRMSWPSAFAVVLVVLTIASCVAIPDVVVRIHETKTCEASQ